MVAGWIRFRFLAQTSVNECRSALEEDWVDCDAATATGGVVISSKWAINCDEEVHIDVDIDVRCLLIIEKEGVYRRLCEEGFSRSPKILK